MCQSILVLSTDCLLAIVVKISGAEAWEGLPVFIDLKSEMHLLKQQEYSSTNFSAIQVHTALIKCHSFILSDYYHTEIFEF